MNMVIGSETNCQEYSVTIRIGSESDKQRILEKYPGTKEVIHNDGYFIVSEIEMKLSAFYGLSKEKFLLLLKKMNCL